MFEHNAIAVPALTQPPMRRRLSSSESGLEVVAACHMVGCSRKVEARGCVAPSSRGLVDGCAGTPCRPPPIRAGLCRRTPHSACAITSACSTQLKDAPSTVSAPARTGLPRLGTGVLARETACATLSGLLASFLSSPTLSAQFFGSTRAADILPSRPQRIPGAARRPCQGWPAGPSVADGLGLDEVEHGARLTMSGCSQCRAHVAALLLR